MRLQVRAKAVKVLCGSEPANAVSNKGVNITLDRAIGAADVNACEAAEPILKAYRVLAADDGELERSLNMVWVKEGLNLAQERKE
jgi:hypothetical protein